jgi:hypothetical protein
MEIADRVFNISGINFGEFLLVLLWVIAVQIKDILIWIAPNNGLSECIKSNIKFFNVALQICFFDDCHFYLWRLIMTLDNFLKDIKNRVALLEEAMITNDSLLWLRACDVETAAHHMAKMIEANDEAR